MQIPTLKHGSVSLASFELMLINSQGPDLRLQRLLRNSELERVLRVRSGCCGSGCCGRVLRVRLSFLDNLPMASCSRRTETGEAFVICLLKDIAGNQMRSAKISMKQYLPLSAT